MEDLNQPLDAGLGAEAPDQGLKITDEIRAYWRETANWALFISVLMFIVIGFVMIGMLFGGYAAMSEGVASVNIDFLFVWISTLFPGLVLLQIFVPDQTGSQFWR
jgi:hypothetical protein